MNESHNIIRTTLVSAPEGPGVYKMLDEVGVILYIGKAKNLKNRLKNYISTQLTTRIINMVLSIRKIEYIITASEAEALRLESRLIKQHQPKYNVLLKDDKSFPYIKVRLDHAFPQIIKYRGKINPDGKYFGPFANIAEVDKVLIFLHKTFKLRNCTDTYFAGRTRPCLQYQIGRCSAPCTKKISPEEYKKSVNEAVEFLKGNSLKLQQNLTKEMEHASKEMDYEKAATIRDKIKNLTYIQTEGNSHISILHNVDVIAAINEAGVTSIAISFYRHRHFYGHKLFFPENPNAELSEVLAAFISDFYQNTPVPKEVIINHELEYPDVIIEALKQIYATSIDITVPLSGPKKILLNKTIETATEGLKKKVKDEGVSRQIYQELMEVFNLNSPPGRIEIYDNSHIMGSAAVGAFVVATPEGFKKKDYRYYNVENKIGDDYAMMREVMLRRLAKLKQDDTNKPDLILIDGGKGHLFTVLQVMQEVGIEVSVIAVAKGPDRNAGKEVFYMPSGQEVTFDRNKPLMKYLQILRDEAHRFAITSHRKKRDRQMDISSLDTIEGIGQIRKRALLLHFGSVSAIRSSSIEEISKVPGISKLLAKDILQWLG